MAVVTESKFANFLRSPAGIAVAIGAIVVLIGAITVPVLFITGVLGGGGNNTPAPLKPNELVVPKLVTDCGDVFLKSLNKTASRIGSKAEADKIGTCGLATASEADVVAAYKHLETNKVDNVKRLLSGLSKLNEIIAACDGKPDNSVEPVPLKADLTKSKKDKVVSDGYHDLLMKAFKKPTLPESSTDEPKSSEKESEKSEKESEEEESEKSTEGPDEPQPAEPLVNPFAGSAQNPLPVTVAFVRSASCKSATDCPLVEECLEELAADPQSRQNLSTVLTRFEPVKGLFAFAPIMEAYAFYRAFKNANPGNANILIQQANNLKNGKKLEAAYADKQIAYLQSLLLNTTFSATQWGVGSTPKFNVLLPAHRQALMGEPAAPCPAGLRDVCAIAARPETQLCTEEEFEAVLDFVNSFSTDPTLGNTIDKAAVDELVTRLKAPHKLNYERCLQNAFASYVTDLNDAESDANAQKSAKCNLLMALRTCKGLGVPFGLEPDADFRDSTLPESDNDNVISSNLDKCNKVMQRELTKRGIARLVSAIEEDENPSEAFNQIRARYDAALKTTNSGATFNSLSVQYGVRAALRARLLEHGLIPAHLAIELDQIGGIFPDIKDDVLEYAKRVVDKFSKVVPCLTWQERRMVGEEYPSGANIENFDDFVLARGCVEAFSMLLLQTKVSLTDALNKTVDLTEWRTRWQAVRENPADPVAIDALKSSFGDIPSMQNLIALAIQSVRTP